MTPQTVIYLLDYADLGGGETSFLAFVRQLGRQAPGLRPLVIVREPGPVAETLAGLGIETHTLAYPLRLRRGPIPWFSLPVARRIERLARDRQATLFHANNFFGMLYAGLAARRLGIPLVWTCHGWFDIDNAVKRWAARRWATHVTCVSEAVRQEAARHLRCPGATSTDYLGITPFAGNDGNAGRAALRATVRREMGLALETPLIGVIGRFQPIKGHQHLLDALPAMRRRVPGLRVWLIGDALFGSAEEQAHKRLIERRVREEGHGECVEFLGFRHDARRLLRALDVLVIPSQRESFSMVAVEGLEAGIAVVGPDGWGPKEIIETPATGLLFEPACHESLARRTIEALRREGEGAAFDPQAGPRRVAGLFTVEAHLRRTLALYASLTGTPYPMLPDPAQSPAESPAAP